MAGAHITATTASKRANRLAFMHSMLAGPPTLNKKKFRKKSAFRPQFEGSCLFLSTAVESAHKALPGSRPHVVAVEEKLPAKNQQPHPQHKTQWTPRNTRAQNGTANGSNNASGDQLHQQLRIGGMRKPVCATADERDQKAEDNVCAHHLRRLKRRKAQQGRAAQ